MKDYPMPRAKEMTWLASRKIWKKQWNGRSYQVSCRQLDCPATKEESLPYANAWMRQQIAEYYQNNGNPEENARIAIEAAKRLQFAPADMAKHILPWLSELGLPEANKRLLEIALLNVGDFNRRFGEETPLLPNLSMAKKEILIGEAVKEFIESLQDRHSNKNLAAQSVDNYTKDIQEFAAWIGKDELVKSINEETVKKYHSHLSKSSHSLSTRGHRWKRFGMAIRQWYSAGYLQKPRNLEDKGWTFGTDEVEKDFWTTETWREEFAKADDFGKLILLLAANCGFYGSDMANLDYDGGETITRYRTKTGKKGAKVTFFLWQETQDALKTHGSLLEGAWKKELVNGKVKKIDRIGKHARSFAKNVKWLRHTSDQFLEESERFRQYKDYFMGHAATKISEINYTEAATPKEMFAYLREQYFHGVGPKAAYKKK